MEERARAWGVELGYLDAFGTWQDSPPETVSAILDAMGATSDRPPVEPASEAPGAEPCLLPTNVPAWGWAAQLYAARSSRSWGIGDLGDLSELCRWSAEVGAGFVLVNPLHAAAPTLPQQPSPYFPSSRRFRNPLYLRIEDVPGWDRDLEPAAGAGRALNQHRRIDRDAVFRLKRAVLGLCWDRAGADAAFDRWCRQEGDGLAQWAVYCALAERHGADWRRWPTAYRRPDRPDVGDFRDGHEGRVRFHQWLQWLLDEQLASASVHLPLMHDLAVGFDPGGADAWLWQDLLAPGMAIGAPPDAFNTKGQVWGLPPFDPWKLRAAGYEPFAQTVRASVRHAGALRIDHALGLARLYWVPEGAGPTEGAYVRYPFGALLDVIARESRGAGAYVVAEDLGTSTPEILDALAARRLLSYRLLWFEDEPPEEYPAQAMAAVTTHDLPTIAGLWTSADLRAQRRLGLDPPEASWAAVRERLRTTLPLDETASVDDVVAAVHASLARAPSMLIAATLDDALGVVERANMPGTTREWPNWSIALPAPLEELEADPRPRRLAEILSRGHPG
jgi:4-alpha-glucanotransferase